MCCLPGIARHVRPGTPSDVFANALTSVPAARRRPQMLWRVRHRKPCRMPLSASASRRPLRNVLSACSLPASFWRVGERSPRKYAYFCPLYVTGCTQPLLLCASAARARERRDLQRKASQCTSCSGAQLIVMKTNDALRFSKEPLPAALLLLSGQASQLVAEMQPLLFLSAGRRSALKWTRRSWGHSSTSGCSRAPCKSRFWCALPGGFRNQPSAPTAVPATAGLVPWRFLLPRPECCAAIGRTHSSVTVARAAKSTADKESV